MTAPTKTLNTANAENFHRSARAPVGIVAAVSMKTIWNRKYANTGAVYATPVRKKPVPPRSEEHTSELQSRFDLVCRLLLEKKKSTQLHNIDPKIPLPLHLALTYHLTNLKPPAPQVYFTNHPILHPRQHHTINYTLLYSHHL